MNENHRKILNFHHHDSNEVNGIYNLNNQQILKSLNPKSPYFSVGIHPWWINNEEILDLNRGILNFLKSDCKPTAIGEIGIDKTINTPIKLQSDIFKKYLKMAKEYKLPVILHCVKAYDEIIKIIRGCSYDLPFAFHDYNGNIEQTKSIMNSEFSYFSFGPTLLKTNSRASRSLPIIPSSKLLVESDDSNLSVIQIYNQLLDIRPDITSAVINKNFNRFLS